MSAVFVDTNILVYAHDRDAGLRHKKARELVHHLWMDKSLPYVSIQVLQELFVNLIRKQVPVELVCEVVEDYLQWNVIDNTAAILKRGMDIHARFRLSFWDALIVAAAEKSGASELWSEDLQTGAKIAGIRIVNPLNPTRSDGNNPYRPDNVH